MVCVCADRKSGREKARQETTLEFKGQGVLALLCVSKYCRANQRAYGDDGISKQGESVTRGARQLGIGFWGRVDVGVVGVVSVWNTTRF